MAYREVHGVEIQEIIRRWQEGLSQRRIARGMGLSRQTVRRYIDAAEAAGLTPDGPEPSEEQLAALATLSLSGPRQVEAPSEELLSPWAEQIERWLETDRLQLTRIQELLAGRGCEVSYTTLRRFIRRRGWRHRLPSTVRMDDGSRARWRRWTSAASASSGTPRAAAGARCGRWSSSGATHATALCGPPPARRWTP